MLSNVHSCALVGVDAQRISVEVDISYGMPMYSTIGLPDAAVRESRDRVKSAIQNCGLEFPLDRVIVGLAPADLKKEGSLYDLPIALGILAAARHLPAGFCQSTLVLGELALSAEVRPIRGVLAAAILARDLGLNLLVPKQNAAEASVVEGATVWGVESLGEAIEHIRGLRPIQPEPCRPIESQPIQPGLDLGDVLGQGQAKRALLISAVGNHNLLMAGSPGSGKTMLARRLPGLLPDMSPRELLDTSKVYSAAGLLKGDQRTALGRPFRAPHHSISDIGLIGGGSFPKPGEVSLAHNGVLFLDELAEFRRSTLEMLRQPLEEGCVQITRARSSVLLPSRFLLVGALNPCPCGYYGDIGRRGCRCSENERHRYLGRLSGPLLDRIDLVLRVHPVDLGSARKDDLDTSRGRKLVERARSLQARRGQSVPNAHLPPGELERCIGLTPEAGASLLRGSQKLGLSARGYHRVLKVARSIADLEGDERIQLKHAHEALGYRAEELGRL